MERKSSSSSDAAGDAAGGGRRSSRRNTTATAAAAAVERKEIERKRRQQMKGLCVKLASLIPKEHYPSKDTMTQLGSLDEAAAYIKKLKERVDELQQKRSSVQLAAGASTSATSSGGTGWPAPEAAPAAEDVAAPVVEVRPHHDGSSLDVVLVTAVQRQFKLHEVVTVLEEEGAEILNANFSVAGRQIFYTIHCRAFSSRIGIEVSRVYERLRSLV
ncbi:hypothetical protein ACP4OV_021866 [Aristida adscensionis]